ncbi:DoxX family protein [Spirosoma arcticum]
MIKSKWGQWIIIALPALTMLGPGITKIAEVEGVVKGLTALGVGPYVTLIGILQLVIVLLYLLPITRNIGFFLTCSYLGGAILAHLSHDQSITVPTVTLTLFWVAMFLTKPGLFLSARV